MRICKRLLVLFCVLAILLASLSSCTSLLLLSTLLLRQEEPTEIPESLDYTLTDADRQAFLDDLNALEELLFVKRSSNEVKVNAAIEKMEISYYHIATQAELAYIYHCLNLADSEKSEAYLYASGMQSDLYAEYEALAKKLDASDVPGKSVFFADWSEADLEFMRGYSEEHNTIRRQNDRILVDYRALSESESYDRAPELYLQIVQNNNRIASLYGYKTYTEYAYAKVYDRDYTPTDAEQIHQSVKTVLIPLCKNVLAKFQTGYSNLTARERNIVRALLEGEYSSVRDLLEGYFSTFSSKVEEEMKGLFQPENHFLTSSKNADPGAFTVYLYEYERPICYFGPGYHDGYTVIHELGHYISAFFTGTDLQMDIAETQSQANEWLFTAYLDRVLESRALAETVFYYQLYSTLQTIVMSSIVDEFEQSVYRDVPANAEEFDSRMEQICQDYGGVESVKSLVADPLRYWRAVTLENPCYYISYSFSMLAALNFYELAAESYSAAQEAYLDLTELELEEGESYCAWLKAQGLQTPFEESYYQKIAELAS